MTAISSIRHAACQTVTLQAAALDGGHLDMAGTTGTLIACDGRDARVECGGCIVDARIAFSCIVRPEPGDRVLMSVATGRPGSRPLRNDSRTLRAACGPRGTCPSSRYAAMFR